MKIAIVCGHFMPEIGYQEVYLANAFSRLKHDVMVFTSTEISTTGKKILSTSYKSGITTDAKYGFRINRLPAFLKLNSKVVSRNLKEEVRKFNPDYIIILALAKLFPVSLLSSTFKNKKRIAIFGDSVEYVDKTSLRKRVKAVFHTEFSARLKKNLYTTAVEKCGRIVLNIPETDTFIRSLLNKKHQQIFDQKKLKLTLGYDPDAFYFDVNERNAIRKQLNIRENEIVFVTSTRINRQKKIEEIVECIDELHSKGLPVRYIIIGFMKDEYGDALKKFIEERKNSGIFHCFGFLDHNQIRKYYAAADVGLWGKAAISIQEAMGTGLQVILEKKDIVSHLLQHNVNGWYHEKNQLRKTMETVADNVSKTPVEQRMKNRIVIQQNNADYLSYDNIASKIITFND